VRFVFICTIACLSFNAWGTRLEFGKPVTVTQAGKGVFHHLESSGRRSLAVNKGTVAVVWEDNSSGTPRIYVAFKTSKSGSFTPPEVVSDTGPAYEPVIVALGDQFVVGWEEKDRLWVRLASPGQHGPVVSLTEKPARQLTMVSDQKMKEVTAVWAEKTTQYYQLKLAGLTSEKAKLKMKVRGVVDSSADKTEQLYPTVQVSKAGTVVAWEDRRQGATRIMTAFAPPGQAFGPNRILNDFRISRIQRFGHGTGAMRVVLAGRANGQVLATWLDKRQFEGGYDVYTSLSLDGGKNFAPDELAQDPLGENTPQWHPTAAVSDHGVVIVAWDDTRDGSPDIWYSLRRTEGWSDDEVWAGSSGEGSQTLPVLTFDQQQLHIAWLDRQADSSSIRYISAKVID